MRSTIPSVVRSRLGISRAQTSSQSSSLSCSSRPFLRINGVLTRCYLHVKSFDIGPLDINLHGNIRYGRSTSRCSTSSKGRTRSDRGEDMDAMTSLELEAQRRRETIAIDRGGAWARL